jgi:L-arabinokinase
MDRHAVALDEATIASTGSTVGATDAGWHECGAAAEALQRCPDAATRHIARAPVRLDVMGGIADYSGGLLLAMPSGEHVCVAVQPRDDDSVVLRPGDGEDMVLPVSLIQTCRAQTDVSPAAAHDALSDSHPHAAVARCLTGALVELLRARPDVDFSRGLTIAATSSGPGCSVDGVASAWVAAALLALAEALGTTLGAQDAGRLCLAVENRWTGSFGGGAAALAALAGRADGLLQIRGDSLTVDGAIPLPEDVTFVGIDCGHLAEGADRKAANVRITAMMGRKLIEVIVAKEPHLHPHWNGRLAHVQVSDYVEHFRDRLPTKVRGKDFLAKFPDPIDSLTRVEADLLYKVRSRTEHHIYEHDRSATFVECLSRAVRLNRPDLYVEAGELMYASHWSYGQRCGLGSIETDALVNLLREQGPASGILGARVSGAGCGGVVVVFTRSGSAARAAVHAAMSEYARRLERTPKLLEGSLPGAMLTGVRTV